MQYLRIKPMKDESYDCYQSAIMTLANYYGIHFEMCAIGRWCFLYSGIHEEDNMGYKLSPYIIREFDALKELHGIRFDCFYKKDCNGKETFIQYLEHGKPILIRSDLFNCHWNVAYQKYYFEHYFLVTGYDDKKDEFIIVDSYMSDESLYSTFDEIYEGMIEYRIMYYDKDWAISSRPMIQAIHNDIQEIFAKNELLSIKEFADDIMLLVNMKKEMGNIIDDLYAVQVVDKVGDIALNKSSFCKMLSFVESNANIDLADLIEKATYYSKEWKSIKLLLMKMCILSDLTKIKKNLSQKMITLYENEMQFLWELDERINKYLL